MSDTDRPDAAQTTPDLHPPLRPPGTVEAPAAPPASAWRRVWIALGVILALILVVVLVLPRVVSPPPVANAPAPATVEPAAARDAAQQAAAREQAQQTLQDVLRLQAQLEQYRVEAWGQPQWQQAADAVAAGDRSFGERRFADAQQTWAGARDTLQQLLDSREQIRDEALAAGWQALEANDAASATRQFELALAIEPDHADASRGLARAAVRDELLRHMAEGQAAEARQDLKAAAVAYRAAQQLDSDYVPAHDSLQRVTTQLTDSAFRAAMSRALQALDAGQWQAAADALDEAAALKPQQPVVQDTRQRLAQARRQAGLQRLRRSARTRAEAEDWQAAVELYRKALRLDPGAAFAREGLARAQQRLELHRQFDHYLKDPARLYSAQPLANAERLLAGNTAPPAGEPRLARKVGQLRRLVEQAKQPLPLTLSSDGETDVVIYHVGRFGRFTRKQLELRPGRYTVVGSRPGYRDVRLEFTLAPGQAPPVIDIRCREPI